MYIWDWSIFTRPKVGVVGGGTLSHVINKMRAVGSCVDGSDHPQVQFHAGPTICLGRTFTRPKVGVGGGTSSHVINKMRAVESCVDGSDHPQVQFYAGPTICLGRTHVDSWDIRMGPTHCWFVGPTILLWDSWLKIYVNLFLIPFLNYVIHYFPSDFVFKQMTSQIILFDQYFHRICVLTYSRTVLSKLYIYINYT
jgi:hypothetical protein